MGWQDAPMAEANAWEEAPVEGEEHNFSILETIENIPSSAGQYAIDLIQPILNPVETGKNLYAIANGAMLRSLEEMGVMPEHPAFGKNKDEQIQAAKAVGRFFKDRYGTFENLQRTVEEDPVGVVADVSALITGGTSMMGKTGNISNIANTVGKSIEPTAIVANTLKYTAGKAVPKALPRRLYKSAAKFPHLGTKETNKLVDAALREKLMPTSAGVTKVVDRIDDLSSQVDELIEVSSKNATPIPKSRLYKYIKDVRKELGGVDMDAAPNLRKVGQTIKIFDEYLKSIKKDTLTPKELQRLKRRTYNQINFDVRQGKANYAKNETRKGVARAARSEIEKVVPETKDINLRLGDLLELRPHLERSADRIERLNLTGISAPLNIGAASTVGGAPGAAIGAGVSILEFPRVKARTALGLESARKMKLSDFADNKISRALAKQGLFQTGRINEELENDPVIRAYRAR